MPGLEPRASCLLGKLSPAESSLLLVLPLVVPAHRSWKFELLESHKKNSEDARGSHQPHQPARVERRDAFLGRTQDGQESHWFPSCSSGDRGSWTPAKYSASGLPLALFLTGTQQDHLTSNSSYSPGKPWACDPPASSWDKGCATSLSWETPSYSILWPELKT